MNGHQKRGLVIMILGIVGIICAFMPMILTKLGVENVSYNLVATLIGAIACFYIALSGHKMMKETKKFHRSDRQNQPKKPNLGNNPNPKNKKKKK